MKAAVDMLCNSSMLRQDQGTQCLSAKQDCREPGTMQIAETMTSDDGKNYAEDSMFPGTGDAALQNKDTSLTPRYGNHFGGPNRKSHLCSDIGSYSVETMDLEK